MGDLEGTGGTNRVLREDLGERIVCGVDWGGTGQGDQGGKQGPWGDQKGK